MDVRKEREKKILYRVYGEVKTPFPALDRAITTTSAGIIYESGGG